jgi:HEAT repeat protein
MEPQLNKILVALESLDESERCNALEDLHQTGYEKIVPLLVTALQDLSVRVREAAVDLLIKTGGSSVADATAALLSSENIPLRNAAIEILEKLGRSAVDALEKHLSSPSVDVRKFAIDTIGKLLSQFPESVSGVFPALIERLSDQDRNVAGAAAEALGFTKNDLAIPFLLEHLSGPNQSSWLQCNIIVALSRISSKKSLEAINKLDKTELYSEAESYVEMVLNGEVL